jgi:hypothetical protein
MNSKYFIWIPKSVGCYLLEFSEPSRPYPLVGVISLVPRLSRHDYWMV